MLTKNIANILTVFRLLAIIPLVGCFYLEGEIFKLVALFLYVGACFTDYLDGYLARALEQASSFGETFDPIADKILVATVLVMLVMHNVIEGVHVIAVILLLAREFTISGLRESMGQMNASLPVSKLAKWKTTLQMFSIIGLLIHYWAPEMPYVLEGSLGVLWIAIFLTLHSALSYVRTFMEKLNNSV